MENDNFTSWGRVLGGKMSLDQQDGLLKGHLLVSSTGIGGFVGAMGTDRGQGLWGSPSQ